MEIQRCPNCGVAVVAMPDGRCPACQMVSFVPRASVDIASPTGSPAPENSCGDWSTAGSVPTRLRPEQDGLEDPIREFRTVLNRFGLGVFGIAMLFLAIALVLSFQASAKWSAAQDDLGRLDYFDEDFESKRERILDGYERSEATTRIVAVVGGLCLMLAFGLGGFSLWWSCFAPKRLTDVIYLRSFRNDDATWPIRVAIQEAIGSRHRLSGIRDPHRRDINAFEKYAILAMAMKYATPRYMDLEARSDWQVRLWNSLMFAKAAVIDVNDLTDFVKAELKLAVRALGPGRVIAVAMAPQTVTSVRASIRAFWPNPLVDAMPIVIWGSPAGESIPGPRRKQFLADVREEFQRILQLAPVEHLSAPAQLGNLFHYHQSERKARIMLRHFITFQVMIGAVQFLAGLIATQLEGERSRKLLEVMSVAPVFLVNFWLLLQNWVLYIRDVGIRSEQLKASIGLILFVLLSGFAGLAMFLAPFTSGP